MKYYSDFIFNKENLIKNLKNIKHNKICAMVKANAYGVGLKNVCKVLKNKVMFFGVANIKEALEIRKLDKDTPILVVGKCTDFNLASKNNISLTLEDINDGIKLEKYLLNNSDKNIIKVHIKINTGMNRLGIKKIAELNKLTKIIKKNIKNVYFEGFFTHFSNIDDKKFSIKQYETFKYFINNIPKIYTPIIHIGGGDAFKVIPQKDQSKFMLRVGFNLYAVPNCVVRIESKIVKILAVNKGEYVGYSAGFFCEKDCTIAVIPLGYADGVNRKLANKGFVFLNNEKCKIVGNVCMDMFFIDVTNIKCKLFDKVIVFLEPFSWAKICKTIPYEIFTNINYKRMNYINF